MVAVRPERGGHVPASSGTAVEVAPWRRWNARLPVLVRIRPVVLSLDAPMNVA